MIMKTKNPMIISIAIITIISFIATVCLYNQLPAQIPIHFNSAGEIDNYGPRSFAFFTAILPLLMLAFLKVVPKIDPKGDAYLKHGKAYNIFILFILLLLIIIHWVTMGIALGLTLSVNKIVPPLTGILFIVIGNYMPQIKQNYTLGIKVPWTYNDEANWRATHRVGGYCFVFAGICFIITGFVPTQFVTIMTIISFVLLFFPILYSYLFFRKNKSKKN